MSLDIPEGCFIGIVGASGSGKTTLLGLLLGFLEPSEGSIVLGGVPLDQVRSAWQHRIGYVPQDVSLLDDTIRANVLLGRPSSSDEDVWVALRSARLDDLVGSLPDGLDTVVGERGARFSGGERQRIGLARALFGSPKILVLDEATSALDRETERQVVEAIAMLDNTITRLWVTHRMHSVRTCDRIVLLDEGLIAASGSWHEIEPVTSATAPEDSSAPEAQTMGEPSPT